MEAGVKEGLREGSYYEVIVDRREAIQHAIQNAKPGDIVLIAGKGHEDYQILKDKTIHFDDREEARAALKEIEYGRIYIVSSSGSHTGDKCTYRQY